MPRPPPPAAALTTSGRPTSSAVPVGSVGTPTPAAIRFASSLSAARRMALAGGPDPHEAGAAHRLCQCGALGQEAPAGVHGVGARLDGRLHEPVGVEVAADLPDVVGHAGVQRASIVGGHRRDRRHAEPPARARDADRHIAPVCDEEPLDPPAHAFPRIACAPVEKLSHFLARDVGETWREGSVTSSQFSRPAPGRLCCLLPGSGQRAQTRVPARLSKRPPAQQKAAIVCLVNELRQGKDLRALRPSAGLERAARLKASGDRPLRALLAHPLRPGVRVDLHRRGLRGRQLDGRRESRLGCRRSRLRSASLRGAARLGVAQGELPAPRLEGHRHLPVAGNALRARSGGPLGDRLREPLLVLLRQAPRDQLHDGGRFSRKARRPS